MPRFFFDFRQEGGLERDETGIEYPSAEAAYLGAMDAARGMWSELLVKRQDPRLCAFEIRNVNGALLFDVPFGELLESCSSIKRPASALKASLAEAKTIREEAVAIQNLVHKVRRDLNRQFSATRQALQESTNLLRGGY